MQLNKKPWAICLISAALLGSYSVSAQTTTQATTETTAEAPPMAAPTSPGQSFTTDLAKANLAKTGVAEPTAEQLSTAEKSIQAQRDTGMGWGQIASSLGLSLGAVVSAANRAEPATQNAAKANKPAESGQYGQSATAPDRTGNSAGNGGGKGGGNSGGKGGGRGK